MYKTNVLFNSQVNTTVMYESVWYILVKQVMYIVHILKIVLS